MGLKKLIAKAGLSLAILPQSGSGNFAYHRLAWALG